MSKGNVIFTLAVVLFLPACFRPDAYRPEASLKNARSATLAVVASTGVAHEILLDLYGYEDGCPDISFRLKSRGYLGSISVSTGRVVQVPIPAETRLLLKGGWTENYGGMIGSCHSVLTFSPEAGRRYVFGYLEPSGNSCQAGLMEVPKDQDNEARLEPVPSAKSIRTTMGFWGLTSDEICSPKP